MFRQPPNRPGGSSAATGVQSVEQLIIAYKKLKEAARLLAAANERAAEEIKISSRIRWTGKAHPFPNNR
jgi:hypothetical protein